MLVRAVEVLQRSISKIVHPRASLRSNSYSEMFQKCRSPISKNVIPDGSVWKVTVYILIPICLPKILNVSGVRRYSWPYHIFITYGYLPLGLQIVTEYHRWQASRSKVQIRRRTSSMG